jgi:hypothetical protein
MATNTSADSSTALKEKKKQKPAESKKKKGDKEKESPSATAATPKKKKKKLSEESLSSVSPPKKKKAKTSESKDENENTNKSSATTDTTKKKAKGKKSLSDNAKHLLKKTRIRKKKMEVLYKAMVEMINSASADELPRRRTKLRVALTCPPDKKTGDTITFTNPHVSGQKLRVKIPANRSANGNFKVTVPVAPDAVVNTADGEEAADHNKISRKFYDLLEDYARAFDEWCDAEGEFRKATGDKDFAAHFERRKKFDLLINEFPTDLKTPVDKPYLQKILRRARQNKHKREQTLARQAQ